MTKETFTHLALTFEEAVELPHFENTSFRIKRKIFATLNKEGSRACLKFYENDQALFCKAYAPGIYPVPNKWGKQGWTFMDLNSISEEVAKGALVAAYCAVAPIKLAAQYGPV